MLPEMAEYNVTAVVDHFAFLGSRFLICYRNFSRSFKLTPLQFNTNVLGTSKILSLNFGSANG